MWVSPDASVELVNFILEPWRMIETEKKHQIQFVSLAKLFQLMSSSGTSVGILNWQEVVNRGQQLHQKCKPQDTQIWWHITHGSCAKFLYERIGKVFTKKMAGFELGINQRKMNARLVRILAAFVRCSLSRWHLRSHPIQHQRRAAR
jgi:hypothetical protein